MGTLCYGDNLDILRRYIKDETVDLVYLGSPFNSALPPGEGESAAGPSATETDIHPVRIIGEPTTPNEAATQRKNSRFDCSCQTSHYNAKQTMKTQLGRLLIVTALAFQSDAFAQPFVTNLATSVYANVPDPLALSFGADGALYVGRDAAGSGGGNGDAVKIHRVAAGGAPVTEYGDAAIPDPDALIVDIVGTVSGTAGSVLVGGVTSGSSGKVSKIAPDGTVSDLFSPSTTWNNPSDFTFDQSGRLLITEINNGKVLVTTNGESPTVLFSLSGAHHIAVDTLDRILVTANNSTQLRLYTSSGTLSNASLASVKTSSPLVRGPGGDWGTDIYAVAPNGHLIRVALDGSANDVGSGFLMASGAVMPGLAFGPDGALYASDFEADRIYRFAAPAVPGTETSIHARVTDPERLSFAPDGTLFVGRDNTGSGGDYDDAVKIHRIGPGGSPVEEFGNTAITDPDAVFYDVTGQFSGTPGAVIVAGTQLNASTGKIVKILPDGSITTIYGPTGSSFNPNLFVLDTAGGRLLFSDDLGGRVWAMTNTTPVPLFSLTVAFPLAVDSLGRIIAGTSDSTSLRLYSADGVLQNAAYAEAKPDTMIIRGPGGFWGTDVYFIGTNYNLMRLDTNGVVSQAGTSFGGVSGFAFGPDGALYASHHAADLIWRVAPPGCLAKPAGLVSWWPGDGDTEDAVGTNDAMAMGGLGFANGMVGSAFDFDGVNAFAQVATPTGLPLGNQPRTLALWFNSTRDHVTSPESALFQYGSEANRQMFGLITSANARGFLYFFGYNADLAGTNVLASGVWYHAAVTYDGNAVTLYLNGQAEGSRNVELNTALNADGLTIGYRPGGSRWQGELDEAMVFDRALSADEIAAIYAAGSNGICRILAPIRPNLSVSQLTDRFRLEWPCQAGSTYQLQSTTNLSATTWVDEGAPFAGSGGFLATNVLFGPAPVKFFRLKIGD